MPAAAIVAAVAAVLVAAVVGLRKVFVQALPEWLRIVRDVDDMTEIDRATGAVRSVQSAEVVLPAERIDAMWSPQYLERLARTYWRFLTRATLGLIRVYYTEGERYVCLLFRPLKLLTFQAPEYEMDDRRGVVRWRIERGLLVARRGRGGDGYLEIDVERRPAEQPGHVNVAIEVAVANFYPADRVAAEPLRLHEHPVAHPRDRHPRLPALAGPPGLRAVAGRALRVGRRGARSVHAAAERAQRHEPGFVTFARARRSWAMLSRAPPCRCSPPRCSPPPRAPPAPTPWSPPPGGPQPGRQRRLPGVGGAGRRALAADRPRAQRRGDDAGHRRLRRAPAPADRLDPVRGRGPAPAGRVLALPGRLGHRRVRRLRLRPAAGTEQKIAELTSKTYSETAPSIELGRLAFVRRGGGPKPGVYYWALGVEGPPKRLSSTLARETATNSTRVAYTYNSSRGGGLAVRLLSGHGGVLVPGLAPARRPAQPAADALQRRVAAAGRPRAGHPALRRLGRPVHAQRRRRQPRAAGHDRQPRPQERPHERAVLPRRRGRQARGAADLLVRQVDGIGRRCRRCSESVDARALRVARAGYRIDGRGAST